MPHSPPLSPLGVYCFQCTPSALMGSEHCVCKMQKQKEEDGFLALGAPTLAGKTGMMMMWQSRSPWWLQWCYFLAVLLAIFPHLCLPKAIHIFMFFWHIAHSPPVIKCVLMTWATSSLIPPNSAYINLCLDTDWYTTEGLYLLKILQMFVFWKE